MRKIGIMCACSLLLALGCDDNRTTEEDGGGIMLMDSGPRLDSGPMGTDSGPPAPMCSVAGATGFPPLPAGCLPRCSAAARSAVAACMGDSACVRMALMDGTPATTIDFGMGMTDTLDCAGCYNWQINSCIFDSCMSEFGACASCADFCDPMSPGCETEEMALNSCIMTNMAALQTCANTRVPACFATAGGFLPDLGEGAHFVTPSDIRLALDPTWAHFAR